MLSASLGCGAFGSRVLYGLGRGCCVRKETCEECPAGAEPSAMCTIPASLGRGAFGPPLFVMGGGGRVWGACMWTARTGGVLVGGAYAVERQVPFPHR